MLFIVQREAIVGTQNHSAGIYLTHSLAKDGIVISSNTSGITYHMHHYYLCACPEPAFTAPSRMEWEKRELFWMRFSPHFHPTLPQSMLLQGAGWLTDDLVTWPGKPFSSIPATAVVADSLERKLAVRHNVGPSDERFIAPVVFIRYRCVNTLSCKWPHLRLRLRRGLFSLFAMYLARRRVCLAWSGLLMSCLCHRPLTG